MNRCLVFDHVHDDDHHENEDTDNNGRRRLPPPAPRPREFYRLQQANQALNLTTDVCIERPVCWRMKDVIDEEKRPWSSRLWENDKMAMSNSAKQDEKMKRTTTPRMIAITRKHKTKNHECKTTHP
jgi:hypothetical protein